MELDVDYWCTGYRPVPEHTIDSEASGGGGCLKQNVEMSKVIFKMTFHAGDRITSGETCLQ